MAQPTLTEKETKKANDTRDDMWLLLALAVSSNDFCALHAHQRLDLVTTVKEVINALPTS